MGRSRQLPKSISSRKAALNAAFAKKINPGPAGNFLTNITDERLGIAKADYTAGFNALTVARVQYHEATPIKRAAFVEAQMYVRHFIMAFNMGVSRGDFTAAQRGYFGIEVNDDTAPNVASEADLLAMGEQIITGNAARITGGGAVMPYPTIADVTAKYFAFRSLHDAYSNLKDALDIQQEAMEAQITEVDNVILKVWNEVETFYSEEPIESKRANAEEWGVIYIHTGVVKVVTLQLQMQDGSELPAITEVLLQDEQQLPNEDGQSIYNTIMQGELTVQVMGDELVPYSGTITVLPEGDQTFVIMLSRV